ncbi:thioredoxin-like protein [Gamsiella multidivaricata]|uniref:thioredoxin-like protein n=1 Tax=Gamsiella multidivaricata TaxID=101098 RepID=UPI0022205183|nr:thioredoxin-like protein [Gamsiella multidivaricata]KAI7832297.1 thioredoxin-like protein [Gamsiella multidivaricata]
MAIKKIEDMEEYLWILSSTEASRLVVVYFSSMKKGSCRLIRPTFERLARQYQDVTFAEVDVDQAKQVALDVGVSSIPTFHFYKDTEKVGEFSGADEGRLVALTEKHRRSEF